MFTAEFITSPALAPASIDKLVIDQHSKITQQKYYVLVKQHQQPLLLLDAQLGVDEQGWLEYHCFTGWIANNQCLVIGYGEHIHFIWPESKRICSHRLSLYFGSVYPCSDNIYREDFTDTCLVCSGENVYLFNCHGQLIWQSPQVAVDGVIIHKIENDIIYGSAELDPPSDEWSSFRLSLLDGRMLYQPELEEIRRYYLPDHGKN